MLLIYINLSYKIKFRKTTFPLFNFCRFFAIPAYQRIIFSPKIVYNFVKVSFFPNDFHKEFSKNRLSDDKCEKESACRIIL